MSNKHDPSFDPCATYVDRIKEPFGKIRYPNHKEEIPIELNDADFLRNLSEKLMTIAPDVCGTDQYHCDRLNDIAGRLERELERST